MLSNSDFYKDSFKKKTVMLDQKRHYNRVTVWIKITTFFSQNPEKDTCHWQSIC